MPPLCTIYWKNGRGGKERNAITNKPPKSARIQSMRRLEPFAIVGHFPPHLLLLILLTVSYTHL